jgi:hypothetical protein
LKNGSRTKLEYEKPEVKTLLIDKESLDCDLRSAIARVDLGKNRAQAGPVNWCRAIERQSDKHLTSSF